MSWCAVVLVELAVAACLDCIDRAVSLRLGVVPLYRPHVMESVPVSYVFFLAPHRYSRVICICLHSFACFTFVTFDFCGAALVPLVEGEIIVY